MDEFIRIAQLYGYSVHLTVDRDRIEATVFGSITKSYLTGTAYRYGLAIENGGDRYEFTGPDLAELQAKALKVMGL